MGIIDFISNHGYCSLYGCDTTQDISIACAYVKIATEKRNPKSAYKLGDIYCRDKYHLEDNALSIYYNNLSAKQYSWI